MTYNEILPLATVKNYLRLDSSFTADDQDIERMVRSAFGIIEKQTGYVLQFRENVTYKRAYCGFIDIYDYPVIYNGNLTRLDYAGKVRFDADEVTVNLGYENIEHIPSALIDCALQMIKVWYFEAEKQENTTLIPENVKEILMTYKRAIVV